MCSCGLSADNVMGIAQLFIMLLAVYFAGFALKRLFHKKHGKYDIMKVKRRVFVLLAGSLTAFAIAFSIRNISRVFGVCMYPSAAETFFVVAYVMSMLAFAYFWRRTAGTHRLHIKEPVFFFGVVCGVFIWLYYLFMTSIMPNSISEPFVIKALNYSGPILVSLIFLLTLIIHPRMKAGVIRTPLWYISSAIFAYFIGYMMEQYSFWNQAPAFMPVFSSALYLLSSLYFLLGFYAAKRKYYIG